MATSVLNNPNNDSGWITATYESGWAIYSSSGLNPLRYRKLGQICELTGVVKPTEEKATGKQLITTLPSGYRPSTEVSVVTHGSSMNINLVAVDTAGQVTVERYGTTTAIAIPSGAWIPIHIVYLVA